jgi:hypothetical protein
MIAHERAPRLRPRSGTNRPWSAHVAPDGGQRRRDPSFSKISAAMHSSPHVRFACRRSGANLQEVGPDFIFCGAQPVRFCRRWRYTSQEGSARFQSDGPTRRSVAVTMHTRAGKAGNLSEDDRRYERPFVR